MPLEHALIRGPTAQSPGPCPSSLRPSSVGHLIRLMWWFRGFYENRFRVDLLVECLAYRLTPNLCEHNTCLLLMSANEVPMNLMGH